MTLEGEPGIGKTRLLLAAGEMATAKGFTTIGVTGDEELRGPFLVARSIVGSAEALRAAVGTPAEASLARCSDAMTGQDDPSLATLPPDAKLLRTLDLGAVAIRDLAADATGRDPGRRPPVGRRRQPAAAPLHRPRRRLEPDPPGVRDPSRGVRVRDRGGQPRRRHGARRAGPAPSAAPLRPARDQVAAAAAPRRHREPDERRRDARAVRGRALHRRGDGARVPGPGDDPGDRRRVDARRQRRAPRALRRPNADLAPRGASARGHQGRARRGGRPRAPASA